MGVMRRFRSPGWALFLISPLVGEVLSGSTPPLAVMNPVGFLLMCGFYGSGALLVHELSLARGRGWTSLLTLGAAYGVVEEGLAVKSFLDPGWKDLGPLAHYGRWLGVNWVWSLQLTLYHAAFSIAIPILLVCLVFPGSSADPWVAPRRLPLVGRLFTALTVLFYFGITRYRPPMGPYLAIAAVVVVLYWLAPRMPSPAPSNPKGSVPSPLRVAGVAWLATTGFYVLGWTTPYTSVPPWATMLIDVAWVAGLAWWLVRTSGGGAQWTDRHRLALASGALGFFIALAPLQEFNSTKRGIALVALAAVLLLLALRRRVLEREAGADKTLAVGAAALTETLPAPEEQHPLL